MAETSVAFKKLLVAVQAQEKATMELLQATKGIVELANKNESSRKTLAAFTSLPKLLEKLKKFTQKTGTSRGEEIVESASKAMKLLYKQTTEPKQPQQPKKQDVNKKTTSASSTKTETVKAVEQNVSEKPTQNKMADAMFNMMSFSSLVEMLKREVGKSVRTDEVTEQIMKVLRRLRQIKVTIKLLEVTQAGITLALLKKDEDARIAGLAKFIVKQWKMMVAKETAKSAKKAKPPITTAKAKPVTTSKPKSSILKAKDKPIRPPKEIQRNPVDTGKKKISIIEKLRQKEEEELRQRMKNKRKSEKATRVVKKKKEKKRKRSSRDSDSDDLYASDVEDEFEDWYKKKRKQLSKSYDRAQMEEQFSAEVGEKEDREALVY